MKDPHNNLAPRFDPTKVLEFVEARRAARQRPVPTKKKRKLQELLALEDENEAARKG